MPIKTQILAGLFALNMVVATNAMADELTVYTDPGQPIIVNESNDKFIIQLQSNPSTGYRWSLGNYNGEFVKMDEHKFRTLSPNLIGSPGVEQWKFKIKGDAFDAAHTLAITFVYARPWDPSTQQWVTFTVVTQPD